MRARRALRVSRRRPIKRDGLGAEVRPIGDLRRDIDRIRAVYVGNTARRLSKFTLPRLADEAENA